MGSPHFMRDVYTNARMVGMEQSSDATSETINVSHVARKLLSAPSVMKKLVT